MTQQLATQGNPTPLRQLKPKDFLTQDIIKQKFAEVLGKRSVGFVTSVLQCVSQNAMLVNATSESVYHSAMVAATLDLPLNNNLGFAYIVPYNNKIKGTNGEADKWEVVAQFQMGYKGFIQLSLRSSQFKTINATDVREGEIKSHNRLTGEVEFDWIEDKDARNKLPIIAYASYFKLLNGFEKTNLMYVEELKGHATKFSQTFKKGFGLWKDDFDSMSIKTVLKLLLSKYAPLSVDMQMALLADQAIINNEDATDVTYVDNEDEPAIIDIDELEMLLSTKQDLLTPDQLKDAQRIIEKKETASYKKLQTLLQSK